MCEGARQRNPQHFLGNSSLGVLFHELSIGMSTLGESGATEAKHTTTDHSVIFFQ